MTGLRRRVSVGFLSIAILLTISGVIAFFELNNLSHDTKSILSVNNRKMELTHQMLDIVQDQDAAFVQLSLFEGSSCNELVQKTIDDLVQAIEVAKSESSNTMLLDSVSLHLSQVQHLANDVAMVPIADSLQQEMRLAYYQQYLPLHASLVGSIYDFTTSSFMSMEPRTEQLQRNAYRAVTPVLISLAVMIVIVLLLYYFMIIYCVNPIVRLNRSLGDFLTYRLPFVSKGDCNDEVRELQEKIEQLTTAIRREVGGK